jgi:hypothetical protein
MTKLFVGALLGSLAAFGAGAAALFWGATRSTRRW